MGVLGPDLTHDGEVHHATVSVIMGRVVLIFRSDAMTTAMKALGMT
jgi:hypothetical protein